MNLFSQYLYDLIEEESIRFIRDLIFEGGAYGHINHVHEDVNMTFREMKEIIIQGLTGKLENVHEKTDGTNIMVTWKNNQLRAARNKSHLKNQGENSLSKEELKNMFSDRPENIQNAFQYAMDDLENALSKIPTEILNNTFLNGKTFMSVEIILPSAQNVIPYGLSLLVFHGIIEYDETGNISKKGPETSTNTLIDIITKVNANIQKNFVIKDLNKLTLKQVNDYQNKIKQFIKELNSIQKKYNLSDDSTIQNYLQKWWELYIIEELSKLNINIDDNSKKLLLNRWGNNDKSVTITNIIKSINNPKLKEWIYNIDKNQYSTLSKQAIEPFEILFMKLGIEILSNASGFMALNQDQTIQQISKNLKDQIQKIKSSNDPDAIKKLTAELNKINKLGGLKNLVGSEGITFWKNGKIYKMTGLFSKINQIMGLFKYKR